MLNYHITLANRRPVPILGWGQTPVHPCMCRVCVHFGYQVLRTLLPGSFFVLPVKHQHWQRAWTAEMD